MVLSKTAQSGLPTRFGDFQIQVYAEASSGLEHIALVAGPPETLPPGCLVRLHSECATGDLFGSRRCDCGEQLDELLAMIGHAGLGVLIYLRGHEGRGIGLGHKIAAYALQDQGLDTVEANHQLGFATDERSYDAAVAILRALGLDQVRLITNNPDKIAALEDSGIEIVERIPIWTGANADNRRYLETKRALMGHLGDGLPRLF